MSRKGFHWKLIYVNPYMDFFEIVSKTFPRTRFPRTVSFGHRPHIKSHIPHPWHRRFSPSTPSLLRSVASHSNTRFHAPFLGALTPLPSLSAAPLQALPGCWPRWSESSSGFEPRLQFHGSPHR